MKKVGTFRGFDVYEDPNAPMNMLYLLNEDSFAALSNCYVLNKLNMGQRIKNWVKKLLRGKR